MSDVLVFDIETQNFFTDPDVGWNNYAALKISVVGVYSYEQDKYFCFTESEMPEIAKLFSTAKTLVGFSSNRYDVPVLNLYLQKIKDLPGLDLWKKDRVDLLDLIESATGSRISLSKLAAANIGAGKDMHGSQAIMLYREGRIEELKKYCLGDVELTKKLYDRYLANGYFMIPDRTTNELKRVDLKHVDEKDKNEKQTPPPPATLF